MVLAVEILNFMTKFVSMPEKYSSINDRNLDKEIKRSPIFFFPQKFNDIFFLTCFIKKKKLCQILNCIFRNLFMKKVCLKHVVFLFISPFFVMQLLSYVF